MRRRISAALEWVVPAENPSGVVYGVIVIGALLAAESGRHESYLDTILSALIAASLYWLAHAYSSVLGRRLTDQERLTARALLRALGHDWALIRGSAIPLLALGVAGVLGADQETAVNVGLWSAVVSLLVLEVGAGVRSRAAPGELILELSIGATMGLAILALKVILH